MRTRFHQGLDELKQKLLTMAGLACFAVAPASSRLSRGHLARAGGGETAALR